MCHNSSACYMYILRVELGHTAMENVSYHFNTKNVINETVCFCYCLAFSLLLRCHWCSESKPILYLNVVHCKFSLCVRVETGPYSCEQTSVT